MDPLYMLKILKAQQASQSSQYKNLKDCWELIRQNLRRVSSQPIHVANPRNGKFDNIAMQMTAFHV